MVFDPRGRSNKSEYWKLFVLVHLFSFVLSKILSSIPFIVAGSVVVIALQTIIAIRRLRDAGKNVLFSLFIPIPLGLMLACLYKILNFDAEHPDLNEMLIPLVGILVLALIQVIFLIVLCSLKSVPVNENEEAEKKSEEKNAKKERKSVNFKALFSNLFNLMKKYKKVCLIAFGAVVVCVAGILGAKGIMKIISDKKLREYNSRTSFEKAVDFENEGKIVHAMRCYYDSMADDERFDEARKRYISLKNKVSDGDLGIEDPDYDDLKNEWKKILIEAEEIMSEQTYDDFNFCTFDDAGYDVEEVEEIFDDHCIKYVVEGYRFDYFEAVMDGYRDFYEDYNLRQYHDSDMPKLPYYYHNEWFSNPVNESAEYIKKNKWNDLEIPTENYDRYIGEAVLVDKNGNEISDHAKFEDREITFNDLSDEVCDLIREDYEAICNNEVADNVSVKVLSVSFIYDDFDENVPYEKMRSRNLDLNDFGKFKKISRKIADIEYKNVMEEFDNSLVQIPGKSFLMCNKEINEKLFMAVVNTRGLYCNFAFNYGKLCSYDELYPKTGVSFYEAVYFCNRLSEIKGLTPAYSVNGESDVSKWDYESDELESLKDVRVDLDANGFRIPTMNEWTYAAKGGEDTVYSGSDNIDEVAWYKGNSDNKVHECGKLKPNGYGLYDMSGNVWEWNNNYMSDDPRYAVIIGGSYDMDEKICSLSNYGNALNSVCKDYIGFRVVRNMESKKNEDYSDFETGWERSNGF